MIWVQVPAGAPVFLNFVCAISESGKVITRTDVMSDGPLNHYNEHDHYNRVTVDLRASDAHFRVFLVPFKIGEPHPQITYDPKTEQATLHWVDQEDIVQFTTDKANRAWVSINRGSTKILPP